MVKKPKEPFRTVAREGYLWVCLSCGRTSEDLLLGAEGEGWNETCQNNAKELPKSSLIFDENLKRVTRIME